MGGPNGRKVMMGGRSFMCLSVPDPPTHLRAVNVTDSTALLLWRPALAAVDKYSIVYGAGTGEQ